MKFQKLQLLSLLDVVALTEAGDRLFRCFLFWLIALCSLCFLIRINTNAPFSFVLWLSYVLTVSFLEIRRAEPEL